MGWRHPDFHGESLAEHDENIRRDLDTVGETVQFDDEHRNEVLERLRERAAICWELGEDREAHELMSVRHRLMNARTIR